MDEYKRRRRRSRAVMSMFLDSLGGSIDNVDVATFDSDGTDLKALVVGIEPIQSGTGDPSPDNVRPISGHTSVNVIVSPTLNPLDGTITNIPLGTTVYGGTLDVLTGVLTVEYVKQAITNFSGVWESSNPNGIAVYTLVSGTNRDPLLLDENRMMSNIFEYSREGRNDMPLYTYGGNSGGNTTQTFVLPSTITTLEEANSWLTANPIECTFRLELPQTIQLTGQQIATFLGTNNVWCDSGKIIHLEY